MTEIKRRSLKKLKLKIKKTIDRTQATHQEVTAKRADNRSCHFKTKRDDCRPKKGFPDFGSIDNRQDKKSVVNWFTVRQWFYAGIVRNNRDWIDDTAGVDGALSWGEPEKACARRLLKVYGEEMTKMMVNWMCDNWEALKSNSNDHLLGAPSVRLLWVSRDMYYSEAKLGKKIIASKKNKKGRHRVGEYDKDTAKNNPGFGW